MIYLGFALDYFLLFFCPIKTYFTIIDLDKNNVISIIIIGIILDLIYHKLLANFLILLILYYFFKSFKFKKKYQVIKNLLLYIIYFNLLFFLNGYSSNYLVAFISGLTLQFIAFFYYKWLLK